MPPDIWLTFLVALLGIPAAFGASLFTCTEDAKVLPAGTIRLDISSAFQGVCSLIEVSEDYETLLDADIKPVARRVESAAWGAYAGDFSHLAFTCTATECQVVLPPNPSGRIYLLKGHSRRVKWMGRMAAWMDKLTFGTTRKELDHALSNRYDRLLRDQMDPTVTPMSSHRQLFREWVGSWSHESGAIGLTGLDDACAKGARYRNFTFLPSHKWRFLTTERDDKNDKTVVKIDGVVHTVVDGWVEYYEQSKGVWRKTVDGTEYKIWVSGDIGPTSGAVKIWVGSDKYSAKFGGVDNPPVSFDSAHVPPGGFIPISGSKVVLAEEYGGEYLRELTTRASSSNCPTDSLTDGYRAKVGKLNDGTYWLHSTSIQLEDNTLENPLADGGKSAVEATSHFSDDLYYDVLCSNVARTFLNEDTCVLAPYGCTTGDLTTDDPLMVCGSPFEVANVRDSNHGPSGYSGFDIYTRYNNYETTQKESVWLEIAINGQDQLRQRVAWALYQLLAVAPNAVTGKDLNEEFLAYYDIFVRHAFGNYFDILKEVTYSPMMGEMLTYVDGKSTGFLYTNSSGSILRAADENFAREVMQLFTIGLYELNNDGTLRLGNSGEAAQTYGNNQVAEYSKVYVGLQRQNRRGNIEQGENMIDPMGINETYKDYFPKLGLNNQYIGDGYPLCSDVPKQHFLMEGAKFNLLGSNPDPYLLSKNGTWLGADPKYLHLSTASALAQALCGGSVSVCDPDATVTLTSELPCDGTECAVDEPRVIEVSDNIWFEYVRPPCVNQAFFDNAKTGASAKNFGENRKGAICSNPLNRDHTAVCCRAWDPEIAERAGRGRLVLFSGERVTFQEAEARCSAHPAESTVCDAMPKVRPDQTDCSNEERGGCDLTKESYWAASGCQLFVKINRAGGVAIIHEPQDLNNPFDMIYRDAMVADDTAIYFRVDWLGVDGSSDISPLGDFLDKYDAKCASMAGCSIGADSLCICSVTVEEDVLFTSKSALASADTASILSSATIAPFEPPSSGWQTASSDIRYTGALDSTSVLEVHDANGRYQYRKNLLSKVVVGGDATLMFRNPVSFFSLADPTIRDARYEMNAALEHYFYHPNMAPFLAIRLAQRFGVSNPTPQYVSSIANAFITGSYGSFGSGQYGCMEATIAALVKHMDFIWADEDPMHGSLFEPYMKVVKVMRALGFDSKEFVPRIKADLEQQIGQQAHKLQHVFSFFKPEYQPPGRITKASYVAPEAEVLNGPTGLNLMNILISYIKYGLSNCKGGIGYDHDSCDQVSSNLGGSTYLPNGYSEKSCKMMINDLADLLTGARLTNDNRDNIRSACEDDIEAGVDLGEVYAKIVQLIVSSPEFHTLGHSELTHGLRDKVEYPEETGNDYKAVVYVMLKGGMDSYNVLVPDASCGSLNQEYIAARGDLALTDYTLKVDASNQPCGRFAIHPELSALADMYNKGELLFMANTGHIDTDGLSSSNYHERTKSTLFAHNFMQEEVQRVDPYDENIQTGVLGRAKDILESKGYVVNAIAVDHTSVILNGQSSSVNATMTVQNTGSPMLNMEEDLQTQVRKLNGEGGMFTNVFSELWAKQLVEGMDMAQALNEDLNSVGNTGISSKDWEVIYKMIATHDRTRHSDRDFFFIESGGWDHHSNMVDSLSGKLAALNKQLGEMRKKLGDELWKHVTIIVASEFGRTLSPNSGSGSDHAWAGNYFMMGGSVDGGKIVGRYPDSLAESSPVFVADDVFRGRLIPTTSWDAIWNGVLQWLGVDSDADLNYCLPNRRNTDDPLEAYKGKYDFPLYDATDLFKSVNV